MKEGMRMPGFTAETSLYKPRRHYNLGVSRGADGQAIIPQADWCWYHYQPEYYGGSHYLCYDACIKDSHCDDRDCRYEGVCDYHGPYPLPEYRVEPKIDPILV